MKTMWCFKMSNEYENGRSETSETYSNSSITSGGLQHGLQTNSSILNWMFHVHAQERQYCTQYILFGYQPDTQQGQLIGTGLIMDLMLSKYHKMS